MTGRSKCFGRAGALVAGVVLSSAASALVFDFQLGTELTVLQGTDPALAANVIGGFTAAGQRWSGLLFDDVTVRVRINYLPLNAGVLGRTNATYGVAGYSSFIDALRADGTSADDALAVVNLPPNPLRFLVNDRDGTTVFDNDNSFNNLRIEYSWALARALSIVPGNDATLDGTISFSSNYSFDFTPDDGITAGRYDFVGVATHEIGHLLGFLSGVDGYDVISGTGPNRLTDLRDFNTLGVVEPLDLFRYSAESLAQGGPGTIDMRFGNTAYFSIDGGTTDLALFSTGRFNGDGNQASHWADDLGIGVMDPTLSSGALTTISALDLQALDVIGWDRSAIPEPGVLALLVWPLAGALWRRRRAVTSAAAGVGRDARMQPRPQPAPSPLNMV